MGSPATFVNFSNLSIPFAIQKAHALYIKVEGTDKQEAAKIPTKRQLLLNFGDYFFLLLHIYMYV